jgi:hypothetical protein
MDHAERMAQSKLALDLNSMSEAGKTGGCCAVSIKQSWQLV